MSCSTVIASPLDWHSCLDMKICSFKTSRHEEDLTCSVRRDCLGEKPLETQKSKTSYFFPETITSWNLSTNETGFTLVFPDLWLTSEDYMPRCFSFFSFQTKITLSHRHLDNFWLWSRYRISLNHLKNTALAWPRDQDKDSDGANPHWCVSILIQTDSIWESTELIHAFPIASFKYFTSTAESQSLQFEGDVHRNN